MRVALLVIVVIVSGAQTVAQADAAKARAANTRGYVLHKQKKCKEAAVEYRNLACVASLTKDSATAIHQLEWVADRATWDPPARSAAEKGRTDHDLDWIRSDGPDGTLLTSDDELGSDIYDLASSPEPDLAGAETSDAKLLTAIASAPGKHDQKCGNAAFSTKLERNVSTIVVANLRDGVALIDASGKVLDRSEPIGCTAVGERITMLSPSPAVVRGAPDTDTLVSSARLIAIMYWAGTVVNIRIFTVHDNKLVRAFDAPLLSSTGDGTLHQTGILGNLLYTAPGAKKPRVFRLDSKTWTYIEEK